MNIVVNTQLMLYGKLDGIGWFTYETISRITKAHPEHRFFLIFDRKPAPELTFPKNTKTIVLYPHSRHPFLWFLRFEIMMPLLLKKLKADVFVSPDGWMTLSTKTPCVQVLHDLNFAHNPGDIPFWTRNYYNILFPRYAKKATRIATVSEFSRQDIIKTYKIPENKIVVTPNGCNVNYSPTTPEEQKETREKYTQGNPFFMYVGALIPRKNIARMLTAFDLFKQTDKQNTKLVVVGNRKWWTSNINKAWEKMHHKDDVLFPGRMQTPELRQLYSASKALVFVPYFEGFGIPILEAFRCDTAVITSNITSMPEVAGDAALLTDPYNISDIANSMTRISTNDQLRNDLIQRGRERRKHFSWDITAKKLWDCIEDAATEHKKTGKS